MAADLTGSTVAKRLASCNKSTRERALRLLKTWLSSPASTSDTVSDDDLLKVWKGLFYCVWHADKLPVQLELINRLASFLVSLELPLSARYFDAFLTTVRREWSGIDHLRLDKFYLLIRKFIHHFFLLLSNIKWDLEVVSCMVSVLSEKSILLVDKYSAQGVNYHIAQVFLDEIKEFLPVTLETLGVLLKPFFTALETSSDKVLISKIKSSIFDRLLDNGVKYLGIERAGDVVEPGSEVEKFGKIALALGLSKKFLHSASSPDTVQGNRKVLFSLHQSFLKLDKDLESSRIQISLAYENDGGPTNAAAGKQVELDGASGGEVSDEKPSKKRKKSKKTSSGGVKKSKSKKNAEAPDSGAVTEDCNCTSMPTNSIIENGGELNADATEDLTSISFDETVMSNLQKQFEKIAAEAGMLTPAASTIPKKRKRTKSTDGKISNSPKSATVGSAVGKRGDKSVKRVRFSMKNNLVWKPHSPLPPQSLRLPPSATPRGSALKKGIPPGPVRETSSTAKMVKSKANTAKKARKITKGVSPAVKRLRKLQSHSV